MNQLYSKIISTFITPQRKPKSGPEILVLVLLSYWVTVQVVT